MSDSTRHEQGMATRRSVLGAAHVDRAEAAKTDFDAPFQNLITEAVWGHVWSRSDWSKRDRSIVTLALLMGLGHWEEVAMREEGELRKIKDSEDAEREEEDAWSIADTHRRGGC